MKARMIMRVRNYSAAKPTANRRRLSTSHLRNSISHALRISPDRDIKREEWNAEMSGNNLILADGEIKRMDDLTQDQRATWLDKIMQFAEMPRHTGKAANTKKRSKYKYKIKNSIADHQKAGRDALAATLQLLIDTKGPISEDEFNNIARYDMPRKKQKLNSIRTYIDAHNASLGGPANMNNAVVQEGFFKFPIKHEIGEDRVSLKEHMEHIQNFLTEYLPDYKLLLLVGHDDERRPDETGGQHPSWFLSAENSTTGRFDLLQEQIRVVNEYTRERYPDKPLVPGYPMDQDGAKLFGQLFQQMFFDYTQERLLTPKGVQLEWASETERRSEQYQRLLSEQHLPKHARHASYAAKNIEDAQKAKMDKAFALSEKEMANYEKGLAEQKRDQANKELDKIIDKKSRANAELDKINKDVDKAITQLEQLQTFIENITEKVIERANGVFKAIGAWSAVIFKGDTDTAKKFEKAACERFSTIQEDTVEKILIGTAGTVGKRLDNYDLRDALKAEQAKSRSDLGPDQGPTPR